MSDHEYIAIKGSINYAMLCTMILNAVALVNVDDRGVHDSKGVQRKDDAPIALHRRPSTHFGVRFVHLSLQRTLPYLSSVLIQTQCYLRSTAGQHPQDLQDMLVYVWNCIDKIDIRFLGSTLPTYLVFS